MNSIVSDIHYKEVQSAFLRKLESFQAQVQNESDISIDRFRELEQIFAAFRQKVTVQYPAHADQHQKLRDSFKEAFRPFSGASEMNQRVLEWPMGYPGDHITLEHIYRSAPVSDNAFGRYMDLYVFSRTLGVGIRERKNQLHNVLRQEFQVRSGKSFRVLNIGCGSCRELYDFGLELNDFPAEITCTDFDSAALQFSKESLMSRGINLDHFTFREMNVLKLVSSTYMQEELGSFDVIYSAGLFDYIQDKGITKIFGSLFENLNPGGVIIAPFKDADYYDTFDYYWIGNWTAFYQRTKREVQDLLTDSIPKAKMEIMSTPTPSINFFILRK
jgi:extracellular factor (EF) 3-hydroxypalmitic acid methyl ester biosynthesis protein